MLRRVEVTLLIVALMAIFFCVFAAKIEVNQNIEYFGEHYMRYMQRTKMIVPHVI